MFSVAIPTLNEADNIQELTTAIDSAATRLGIPVIIINSDNSSEDGTSALFQATPTTNQKVSLKTAEKGKGRNVKSIFTYILDNDINYCFFIDGDITSFEDEWLRRHCEQYNKGADYVVPNYARNMNEGNTTNHFAYPLLNYHSRNKSPQQPIAGDFGISRRLIEYLYGQSWPKAALGYGIDIFMTTHAIFSKFKVVEIELDKKLHKPSYNKMIGMFEEVATTYYEAIDDVLKPSIKKLNTNHTGSFTLIDAKPILFEDIEKRKDYALGLIAKKPDTEALLSKTINNIHINTAEWAQILAYHEKQNISANSTEIAKSILPYYLLRVTSYLEDNRNAASAEEELKEQAVIIAKTFFEQGL